MKYSIRDFSYPDKPEPEVEVWLENFDGYIRLMVGDKNNKTDACILLEFGSSGEVFLRGGLPDRLGFDLTPARTLRIQPQ